MTAESDAEFQSLIDKLPQTAEVLALRTAALAADDAVRAEKILRSAVRVHDDPRLRVTLGRVLMRQRRHQEAMGEMVAVLRHEPTNETALLLLASCLLECGELDRGAKMLQKARANGAPPNESAAVEARFRSLVASSEDPAHANLTLPPIPGETDDTAVERGRHSTLMGRPNPMFDVGDPKGTTSGATTPATPNKDRLAPPAPLQSGTFANLDTYDIDGDPDEELDATMAHDRIRMSDDGPIMLDSNDFMPIEDDEDDYAAPDEHTYAMSVKESDLAAPDEHTAHVFLSDDEPATRSEDDLRTVDHSDSVPSIQYDAGFAEEARQVQRKPPSDLNQLPAYDSSLPRMDGPHIEEDPTRPDFPPTKEDRLDEYVRKPGGSEAGLPGLDPALLFDDMDSPQERRDARPSQEQWQNAPSPARNQPSGPQNYPQDFAQQRPNTGSAPQPHPQPPRNTGPQSQHPSQSQPHHQQHAGQQRQQRPAPNQPQRRSDGSFELEGNSVPVDQRWSPNQPRREPTAVAAAPKPPPASRSIEAITSKRGIFVLIAVLGLCAAGFLGLTYASGRSLDGALSAAFNSARAAQQPDTFEGYQTAEREYARALEVDSFMGRGFDEFVESNIPIPGLSASETRAEAAAELAAVSALLEYRFEEPGSRSAADKLKRAETLAADHPMASVAEAYIELSQNHPHDALETLDAAHQAHPSEFRIDEVQAWTLLEMERIPEAAKAVQPLRTTETLTPHQKFLLASVDAARGDKEASKKFAEVFAESADHVDSRIARSYVLRDGEEDFKKAENVLDTVSVKLKRKTSRFQKARAKTAYGALYRASGDKERAEERFNEAITKMPTRAELYMPLLDFHLAEGRTEDVEKLLEKAKRENAESPAMSLFEARLRLLESKPELTERTIQELEFQDTRTAYLRGLALLDQSQYERASKVLEEAQSWPGDNVDVRALFFLARSRASDEAVEDSVYQLETIKSKAADDPEVHWASGVTHFVGAAVTTSKTKRAERLKTARLDLERAIELRPNWPLAHVALCEVHQQELEVKKADSACLEARALAPKYVPAIVATARLRLMQGRFEDAQKLAEEAAAIRSEDPTVGLLSARVAIEQRRLEDARVELNRWLGKSSVDPYELALLEGRLEFTRENYTKAAGYLKQAFTMRPNDGEATIYYGHTLARLGQFDSAGKLLKNFLSHPTWSGYAWATLGEVRRKQRRFKDAFENLAAARRIYNDQVIPDRYWSHLYAQYALTYKDRYRKWRHPKVWEMLKRGRESGDPMDPELNMTFGLYFLEKRRPNVDAATRSFEKVVEAAPFRCDAIEVLLKLYEKDDADEKAEELAEIQKENCADPEASE